MDKLRLNNQNLNSSRRYLYLHTLKRLMINEYITLIAYVALVVKFYNDMKVHCIES